MARPRRDAGERAAVQCALSAMSPDLSARTRARILAQRVVAEFVRHEIDQDPMAFALAVLEARIGKDPVVQLAHDPCVNVAGAFEQERVARFRARGCRQLDAAAWAAETRAIGEVLVARLCERWRR